MFFHYYHIIFDCLFPKYTWRKKGKGVYLTFDDGPVPEATLEVLDILKQFDVKATFFCVGENVQNNPYILKRILAEGHSVGNHTFNHLKGTETDYQEYLDNVQKCTKAFTDNGVKTPLLRPAHGRMTRGQRNNLATKYEIIMWSVLSGDFSKSVSVEKCLDKSVKYTKNGSIVLFHDSIKTIDKVREVLPRYIEQVQSKGLEFKCL